jgi:hypothetical protein
MQKLDREILEGGDQLEQNGRAIEKRDEAAARSHFLRRPPLTVNLNDAIHWLELQSVFFGAAANRNSSLWASMGTSTRTDTP